MTETLNWFFKGILITGCFLSVLFVIYSFTENEKRAALKMLPVVFVMGLLFVFSFYITFSFPFLLFVSVLVLLFVLFIFIPFENRDIKFVISAEKFDERDVMFSRMELEEGTQRFEEYYSKQPQNKAPDDAFRLEPGLLQPGAKYYHPFLFEAANATFSTVNLLQPLVEGQPAEKLSETISETQISAFIKNWALKLGAHSIGFTNLQPHHIYSFGGRGNRYGQPIKLNHKFAVVFTVEMDRAFIQCAPQGPVIMESAKQYLNAGQIGIQLAQFIRNLGHEARAHIDANYQVICPLVAQDGGLGTIGRMGLLMTPKLGPRVRIGVVTTNLQFKVSSKSYNPSVLQFCASCKKCAINCPSQAISFQTEKTENGWKPWKINHEKCFTYWTKTGTDCGRCIAVCPFSHPNNKMHNLVRKFIHYNSFNRWIAIHLDNFFYGKKPVGKRLKFWMELN